MERLIDILKKEHEEIQRIPILPYKMDIALQVFKALGSKHIGKEFLINEKNLWIIKNIIRWAHADPEMEAMNPEKKEVIPGNLNKGIYLAGPTGTGKTVLMRTLAQYLTIDNAMFLRYESRMTEPSRQLLTFQSVNTNRATMYYSENGELYHYLQEPTICFQDLGVEQVETMFMGTRTKVMRTIIQERGDARGLITHFTSNNAITDRDNLTMYEERGVSRLKKMCNYFELRGQDLRG